MFKTQTKLDELVQTKSLKRANTAQYFDPTGI